MENSRRKFFKKVAYATPTIVALGALTQPTESLANGKWFHRHNSKVQRPNFHSNNNQSEK